MNESATLNPSTGRSAEAQTPPARRLMSLDALRGFDMFWIVGGEELVHKLYQAWPIGPLHLLDEQMDHKPWTGVGFYDLIFPLFVFIVGVSIVLSLTRAIEQFGKPAAIKRIFIRSLIIYIFGLLVYGGLSKGIEHIRWMGVLQRIALCYFFTGLIFCAFRLKGMIAICASLLVGYWALVSFVPVRDFNLAEDHLKDLHLSPGSPETARLFYSTTNWVRGRFDDGLNLPQHLDFQYLPGHRWDGAYDPEGILSTLPAVATCLLGVFAGLLLRNSRIEPRRKADYLLLAGLAGVLLGHLWGFQFPIIKKIWTSSYVLVAGGYSALLLGFFYLVVDVWKCQKWCQPFVWIGMNSITVYLANNIINFDRLGLRFAGGDNSRSSTALHRNGGLVNSFFAG